MDIVPINYLALEDFLIPTGLSLECDLYETIPKHNRLHYPSKDNFQ